MICWRTKITPTSKHFMDNYTMHCIKIEISIFYCLFNYVSLSICRLSTNFVAQHLRWVHDSMCLPFLESLAVKFFWLMNFTQTNNRGTIVWIVQEQSLWMKQIQTINHIHCMRINRNIISHSNNLVSIGLNSQRT